jgi:tRNA pseudouridine55 synthase
MNGVIIVDKPAGWTSHDVVNRLRRILGQRSVGHLGTLDPLATGVLPLVTGSLTRLAQFYIASEKTYEGVIRFGFATNTYDADGEPPEEHAGTAAPSASSELALSLPKGQAPGSPAPIINLNLEVLQKLAAQFLGLIEQVPPPFCAKKIKGVPAYKLARRQEEVILPPIQIEIKEFAITAVEADRAHFRARVASGTYMRSIAHEMGQRLGCGAHLESLRRTAVAEFNITQAHTIEELEAQVVKGPLVKGQTNGGQTVEVQEIQTVRGQTDEGQTVTGQTVVDQIKDCHSEPGRRSGEEPAFPDHEGIAALFIHPRQLLPQFPSVTADEPTAARIRSGRPVNLPQLSRARQVKVFAGQTDLIAIATRVAGTLFHPKIVFPPDNPGVGNKTMSLPKRATAR